ncbi:fibronectin type III domain-containing protein [Heyndrickxia oleronia]|uniref:fibronectin type III domain-containing protein n=1 Tax=Heyndrickxia oleronia TaxID=38875 RepID=UPI0015D26704|nr:fibronectin type III domain-containing protein [Heyndrickxia oleronia]NYV66576.1 fibronectin type III domain-containing protein [Bacillus sp. Gen3]
MRFKLFSKKSKLNKLANAVLISTMAIAAIISPLPYEKANAAGYFTWNKYEPIEVEEYVLSGGKSEFDQPDPGCYISRQQIGDSEYYRQYCWTTVIKKGNFVGTVKDPIGNAYPSNGVHSDGYYYEYTGYDNNSAPTASTIPSQTISGKGKNSIVTLSSYFRDPDGDVLTYSANSSNSGVVTAQISGDRLILTGVKIGSVTITVTAKDPSGESVSRTFSVTVQNQAPTTPTISVPNKTFEYGDKETITWSASSDLDGDSITYELEVSYNKGSTWSKLYNGPNRYFDYTVPNNQNNAMFRVRAFDGYTYSQYSTSSNQGIQEAQYYWSKYSVANRYEETLGKGKDGGWTSSTGGDSTKYSYLYDISAGTSYTISNGKVILIGSFENSEEPIPTGTIYYTIVKRVNGNETEKLLVKNTVTDNFVGYSKTDFYNYPIIETPVGKGPDRLISNQIKAGYNTYPNNGLHTDGYWYIRGQRVATPDITPPIIELIEQENYGLTSTVEVKIYDHSKIKKVKYAKGMQNINYFSTNGTEITTSFVATENGDYTVYAEDEHGNKSVEVIKVAKINPLLTKDPGDFTLDDLINGGIENVLPEYFDEYKDALVQYQKDKGSKLTLEDIQLVIDAINAVKKAEKNPTYENIDNALNLVNKLINGKLKNSLNDRLKVLVTAPTNLKVEDIQSTTATLTWGSSFEGANYIVKRDGVKVYEGKELTFTDKGLTPNKLHRYTVITKIQNLESTETETTTLTKANPVRNIAFSEIDHQGFRVTWDANGNTNGTRYQVLVKDGDKVKVDSDWITNLTGTAYNLEPGKSYNVEIKAMNDEGIETEVVSKQITVLDYVIDEIQNLRVSKINSKKVIIEWDHNQPDIEFIIEKSRGTIQSPSKVVEGNKFEDTDLQVGKEYTYNVIARNKKYGTKSQAATVTVKVPLPDAPTAVQNLKYDQLGNGSYKFTWDAVEGANLYYFEIYDGSTRKVFKSTKDLEVTTDKLEQGKTYSVSVYAIDVYGQQTEKTTIEVKTNDLPPVANITDFNAKVDKTTLTLSWEKVNGAYGYYVEKYVDGQRKTRKYVTETSYQEEVTPGTYEYRIQTYHSSGMLEPVSKIIVLESPNEDGSSNGGNNENGENSLAISSNVNGNNVSLTWNDVPDRYGYYVERYLDGKRQFRKYSSTPSFEDKNVAAGVYEYRVIAYTKSGMQEPISHIVKVGETAPESIIKEISAVVNGQNVELSWNTVDSAYYYYIERYDNNGNRNYRRSVSTNSYIDQNVSNGEYEYKVIAYTPSGFQDPVTKKVQVGKPLENVTLDDFEIKVEGQTVTINWEKLDDIYGYYIERYDSKGNRNFRYSLNADQTEYVDSNVPYGEYQYKVIVYSKTGDMNPTSKTVSIEAPNDTLDSFDIEVEGKDVKLSWKEVPNTYYYYVERYRDGKRELRKTTNSTEYIDENVAEGDYEYRVIVYSKINGMQDPIVKTIKVGNETPPPVDENDEQVPNSNSLESVEINVEGNNVTLSWNKVDNIYNYYVQRFKDGRRQLHKSTGLETTYLDQNLADGEYEYHVFIYDKNGYGKEIIKKVIIRQEVDSIDN